MLFCSYDILVMVNYIYTHSRIVTYLMGCCIINIYIKKPFEHNIRRAFRYRYLI